MLINKAMIEIPPKFAGMPPVNPEARAQMSRDCELGMEREWKGAEGLAEDVRYYGKWMRDEAGKCIGHPAKRMVASCSAPSYGYASGNENPGRTWRGG